VKSVEKMQEIWVCLRLVSVYSSGYPPQNIQQIVFSMIHRLVILLLGHSTIAH
jgi:hypothetical protein